MRIVTIAVAGSLAGCASTQQEIAGGSDLISKHIPANYRAATATYIRETWKDPYSIRDASISEPFIGVQGFVWGERPLVCVKMNAKNSFGAYIGVKPSVIYFKDGKAVGASDPINNVCDRPHTPFPEVEKA